jgi:hypothetical protein
LKQLVAAAHYSLLPLDVTSLVQALEELAVLQAEALASQQHPQQEQQQQELQQQQQEDDSEATDAVDDVADLFSVPISIGGAAYTANIQPGETITAAAQRFCATHAQDLQRCVLATSCCATVRAGGIMLCINSTRARWLDRLRLSCAVAVHLHVSKRVTNGILVASANSSTTQQLALPSTATYTVHCVRTHI